MGSKYDTHKFLREIPSPIALDYPHRNITRIIGATPSSITTVDLKDRINNYFKGIQEQSNRPVPLKQKNIQTINDFLKLEEDINLSTLQDIAPDLPITEDTPRYDYKELVPKIAKDMNFSKDQLEKINVNLSPYLDALGTTSGDRDEGMNITLRANLTSPKLRSTLYHEMLHASDRFHYKNPQTKPEYLDPANIPSGDPTAFDVADALGTTRHHLFYTDESDPNDRLPGILVRPFYKAGVKQNPTFWEKMLKKIKDSANPR